MPDLITCPKCGDRFEATAVMREQVERELRRSFQEETQRQVARAVEAAQRQLDEAAQKEAAALRRQRELEEIQRQSAVEFEKKFAVESARIRELAETEAKERSAAVLAGQMAAKDKELAEARVRLTEAAGKEAGLLRKEREMAEKEIQSGIEMERRINAEAAKIREKAEQDAADRARLDQEKQRLEAAERELKIDSLKKHVADLQQKLQQGSMQVQGEAQEVVFKTLLEEAFPRDTIEDVPKGMEGADLVQHVCTDAGLPCGVILWESKRTKHWSDEWLAKLSQDRTQAKADVAVLVSQALPDGITHFGERNGIWVCAWPQARALAAVLRAGMAELAKFRRTSEGSGDKIKMLYAYLTSSEFKNRMNGSLEAIATLRTDLDDEKRAMTRMWAKREKQIDRAEEGIERFVGDVQGIGGLPADAIPTLGLELPVGAIGAGEEEDDSERAEEAPLDRELVEILFALLPEDGSAIANAVCQQQFFEAARDRLGRELQEDDYLRCRGALLEQQRARKGKGRGGSVART